MAVSLAQNDNQGVIFIIPTSRGGNIDMEKTLDSKVIIRITAQAVPGKNAPRIGIDHKNRTVQCVQQYRVRGFVADTVNF